jgi:hypothetical protein
MSTKFHGIFSEVFGGILTVRGFASFSDLAKCSQPNSKYQRRPYPEHQAKIEQFYRNKHDLFFPELVFAMPIDNIGIESGKYLFSNIDKGVKVEITGTRTARSLERVNITLPDLPEGQRILQRIDGNHRLRAYENLGDTQFDRYLVPFCIVLLRKDQALPTEKELFFNINSKAKPLTSEEIYRSIIEDEVNFPADVLDRNFGPEFVLCRQTRKALDFQYLPNLRGVFGQKAGQEDCRCSVLIESVRDLQRERDRLRDTNPLPDNGSLLEAIRGVNASYTDERLQRSNSPGLFSAFLFFAIQAGPRYRQWENWVLRNHQYELQTINASDLIRIFEKVAESRHRQIFVSMQFKIPDKGGQWIDNPNWRAIESAVADLNRDHHFDLKLKPIRIDEFNKGYSYPISGEIFQLIEDSGYLIADLTAGNKNVYHEVGLLMGLNQARQKQHDNFLLLHNSSVGDVSKDFGFNITDFKQLRLADTHAIGTAVKRQISIFYGLPE